MESWLADKMFSEYTLRTDLQNPHANSIGK